MGGLEDVGYEREAARKRRVPVQRDSNRRVPPGTTTWEIHYVAWTNYNLYHYEQSAERIAQRGGFGYREIQCALAGHYRECDRCQIEHPPVPEWKPL